MSPFLSPVWPPPKKAGAGDNIPRETARSSKKSRRETHAAFLRGRGEQRPPRSRFTGPAAVSKRPGRPNRPNRKARLWSFPLAVGPAKKELRGVQPRIPSDSRIGF